LSGCSESLLYFAYTITPYNHHFIIIPLAPSSAAVRLRLPSSGFNARLSFFDHGHIKTDFRIQSPLIYLRPLLYNEPFFITVSEETRLLSQAMPRQRFTVITLPWKRLLQTRYSMLQWVVHIVPSGLYRDINRVPINHSHLHTAMLMFCFAEMCSVLVAIVRSPSLCGNGGRQIPFHS
jgi:hypothetical protein